MSCCNGPRVERDPSRPVARMRTAAKGAATMARAYLRQGLRAMAVAIAYSRICDGCPMSSRLGRRMVCGTLGVDHTDHPDPAQRSCGCWVDPAGKPRVDGAWCPQGKWPVELTVGGSSLPRSTIDR